MSAQNISTGANILYIPKKSKVNIVSNVRMSAQNIFAFLCKYSDRGDGQDGSEEDFMESNICPPLTPRTPQPKPERRKQKRIETTETKANQCFPPLTPPTPQAKPKRQKENHKKTQQGQSRNICPPLIHHN